MQSRFNENEISYRNQLIDINEYLLEKTKVKSTLLQFVIPQLEEFLDSIEYKFEKLLNGNAEDIINFLFNNKKIFNILIGTSDSLEINFVSILNEDIKNCFIVGRKMLSSSVIGHWQILSFSQANDSGSGEYLRNELVKVSIALQQLQKSLYFTTNHVLEKYNVKLLGANVDAINIAVKVWDHNY